MFGVEPNPDKNVFGVKTGEVEQAEKPIKEEKKFSKKFLIILFSLVVVFGAGAGVAGYFLFGKTEEKEQLFVKKPEKAEEKEVIYSPLTGIGISDAGLVSSPTYCVQVPNGLDGARPQAGLSDAGVVFEAIAEAGITRFAAIFQNPKVGVIGPVRSLRIYYLDWDTPFDCTIVHAGGAANALQALAVGGYRDLTENYSYMWRGSTLNRAWNNLFTSNRDIAQFNADGGYMSSEVKGFTRETPKDAENERVEKLATNPLDIDTKTEGSVKEVVPKVTNIDFRFGGVPSFNPVYTYNLETNSYDRAYESGERHVVYDCPDEIGEVSPEYSCGEAKQLSPKVVVGMIVSEGKDTDNYHERITTIGTGKVYIFQNGDVVEGTWEKASRESQIVFKDGSGVEIKLVPGQTFVSAIPDYGSVEYN